jgi:hypothetical protein
MGILSICAVMLGQSGDVSLEQINNYNRFGHHKDFVAVMFLLCVFIKSGLFIFHNSIIELASATFNRLNFIVYCATPLVGFLALNKMHALLFISEYSYPILFIFSFASIIWGSFGTMAMDNIKQKSIYFAMMFWGLMYGLVALNKSIPQLQVSVLIVAALLFSQILMLINRASSNEKYVSGMGGFIKSIKFTWFLTFIVLSVYINQLWIIFSSAGYIGILYILLFVVGSAHIMHQIYLGKSNADERVLVMLRNPSILLSLPILICTAYIGYIFSDGIMYTVITMILWTVLFIYNPLSRLNKLYGNDWIQDSDYLSSAYGLLIVTPIRVLGRMLWLAVDFVFIERTIINSITKSINFLVMIFCKIHTNTLYSYSLFTLLGFALIFFVWINGGR